MTSSNLIGCWTARSTGIGTLEDLVHVAGGAPEVVGDAGPSDSVRPPASTISLTPCIEGSRYLAARSASRALWTPKLGSDTTRSAPARSLAIAANAPSNSSGSRVSSSWRCHPNDRAATLTLLIAAADRISRIRQDRHSTNLGNGFLEQFQLFAERFDANAVSQTSDVPARAREARNESEPDQIANDEHDDGDRACGVPGRYRGRGRGGCDDFHVEPCQFGCEVGQPIKPSFRKTIVDDDVPSFNPP